MMEQSLSPKYNLNLSTEKLKYLCQRYPKMVRSPQGIIRNIERAATSRRIYVMVKVSSNKGSPVSEHP